MPAERIKLTKRVVDSADPRAVRYVLFDADVRGFGLRVFPSGQKSWIFEYKSVEGGRKASTKRVTIGKCAEFTPDEARKQAEKLRAQVKIGSDPQAEKIAKRKAATVKEVADSFLEQHISPKRKARTVSGYTDIVRRIVVPELGTKKAQDLTRSDVARLHLAWAERPFQANRVLGVISSMYTWAGRHGLVTEGTNPARGVENFNEKGRERLLSVHELERLGSALREAETNGIPWRVDTSKKTKHVPKLVRLTKIDVHAAAALRLLILTGARLSEILSLEWAHVDLERGLLLLPDSKTGKKTIVLNAPAVHVLEQLPHVGRYVIAGESAGTIDEKPRVDLKRPWQTVRRHAGLEDVRLHDLRHNFASFGAGEGMGLPIIGKLLGHLHASTTQRYAHLDADPLRRASDRIGNSIAAAMGETRKSD